MCSDTGLLWKDQDQFTVECPSGCIEDLTTSPVYGTKTYTLVKTHFLYIFF